MTQVALEKLEDDILEASRDTSVGTHVRGVQIESDRLDEGDEFLRIIIQLDTFDNLNDTDMINLLKRIEAAVIDVDDRFPSIRFSDAN